MQTPNRVIEHQRVPLKQDCPEHRLTVFVMLRSSAPPGRADAHQRVRAHADELLSEAFDCPIKTSQTPPPGTPYMLPHLLRTPRAPQPGRPTFAALLS